MLVQSTRVIASTYRAVPLSKGHKEGIGITSLATCLDVPIPMLLDSSSTPSSLCPIALALSFGVKYTILTPCPTILSVAYSSHDRGKLGSKLGAYVDTDSIIIQEGLSCTILALNGIVSLIGHDRGGQD